MPNSDSQLDWQSIQEFFSAMRQDRNALDDFLGASMSDLETLKTQLEEKWRLVEAGQAALIQEQQQFDKARCQWEPETTAQDEQSATQIDELQTALSAAQEQIQQLEAAAAVGSTKHESQHQQFDELQSQRDDLAAELETSRRRIEQLENHSNCWPVVRILNGHRAMLPQPTRQNCEVLTTNLIMPSRKSPFISNK